MEPMNLGSPSGGGASPAYLPCYLLGDHQAQSPDKSRNVSFAGTSPQDYNRSVGGQKMPFGSQFQHTPTHTTVQSPSTPALHKPPGPPIVGLFDTVLTHNYNQNPLEQTQLGTPIRGQHYNQQQQQQQHHLSNDMNRSAFSLNQSVHPLNDSYLINNTSLNSSRQILSSIDPYGSSKGIPQSYNQRDNFWVTIFGYSPSESKAILQHFGNCGKIVDKILAPNNGNWMHIKFITRSECDRALNYNQKILFNNVMIGVTICRDRSIVEKENIPEAHRTQIPSLMQNSINLRSPVIDSPVEERPLGFLDRAMEVFFNW